jgi:hypothetical protein
MRIAILALGLTTTLITGSLAMPAPPMPIVLLANTIQVHGCHHYYDQDVSGWHRHDNNCATGSKNRKPVQG